MTTTALHVSKAFVATSLIAAAVLAATPAAAQPGAGSAVARPASGPVAVDDGDLAARNLFRAQRYADALAIYRRRRAETQHPTYLRNIGRCLQMLRQPAPAIEAFQAYLREARDLGAAERAEVDGYIGEMQRLELAPPPVAAATPAATSSAGPHRPITHTWWFWTGVGVVLATGIIAVIASSGQDHLPCPSGAVCPP
jgi:hypothetical protein